MVMSTHLMANITGGMGTKAEIWGRLGHNWYRVEPAQRGASREGAGGQLLPRTFLQ